MQIKRIAVFIGLKIWETFIFVGGVALACVILFGLTDWIPAHYPFATKILNFLLYILYGLIGVLIVCGAYITLSEWFKENWKKAGKIVEGWKNGNK